MNSARRQALNNLLQAEVNEQTAELKKDLKARKDKLKGYKRVNSCDEGYSEYMRKLAYVLSYHTVPFPRSGLTESIDEVFEMHTDFFLFASPASLLFEYSGIGDVSVSLIVKVREDFITAAYKKVRGQS
jgi:hypothetical protein